MITDEWSEMAIKNKLNIKNGVALYQVAKLFNIPDLYKAMFSYIERCFTMVAETNSFLELDYNIISYIVSSSGLLITTEVEVFNAADSWLSHDITERRKFAKNLLLKVRLTLLSDHALTHLLNKSSSLTRSIESRALIENVLDGNKSNIYYTRRYCNQNNFNVVNYEGLLGTNRMDFYKNITQFDTNSFKTVNVLPSMTKTLRHSKAVCLKGEIYVLRDLPTHLFDRNLAFEKYSAETNTWNEVASISIWDGRKGYGVCAFMDKIFIIGGWYEIYGYEGFYDYADTNSCLQFDTKNNSWKEVVGMNEARSYNACAVFEGRIVVSGGRSRDDMHGSNSVEVYDVFANKWSFMPKMTRRRGNHKMRNVRNKLFVIGERTNPCEVFDKTSMKFVALKSPEFTYSPYVVSIGRNIYVFRENSLTYCYDLKKNEWSTDTCKATYNTIDFSYVKLNWF